MTNKASFWKRKIALSPLTLVAIIAVAGIVAAAAVYLGPVSTAAPTSTKAIGVTINGIPAEVNWANQYTWQQFNASVTSNTYTNQKTGVVTLIALDKACADLTTYGFVLQESTTQVGSYANVTGVSGAGIGNGKGGYYGADHCVYIGTVGTYGLSIPATTTGAKWYFQYEFGNSGDVSGLTFAFTAQAYAP